MYKVSIYTEAPRSLCTIDKPTGYLCPFGVTKGYRVNCYHLLQCEGALSMLTGGNSPKATGCWQHEQLTLVSASPALSLYRPAICTHQPLGCLSNSLGQSRGNLLLNLWRELAPSVMLWPQVTSPSLSVHPTLYAQVTGPLTS